MVLRLFRIGIVILLASQCVFASESRLDHVNIDCRMHPTINGAPLKDVYFAFEIGTFNGHSPVIQSYVNNYGKDGQFSEPLTVYLVTKTEDGTIYTRYPYSLTIADAKTADGQYPATLIYYQEKHQLTCERIQQ